MRRPLSQDRPTLYRHETIELSEKRIKLRVVLLILAVAAAVSFAYGINALFSTEPGVREITALTGEMNSGDDFTFYFETSNANKGRGVTGEENGYLYYKGMRLEADDDYAFYALPNESGDEPDYYLVNASGKIQKPSANGKKIDPEKIENEDYCIVDVIEKEIGPDEDIDDYNVYIKGSNKTGKITDVYYGKSSSAVKDDTNKLDWDALNVLEADNSEDVDFGWED